MEGKSFWTSSIPVWVSRKTADGDIAAFSISGWLWMLGWILILLNFFIWSFIGLFEAVRVIF